MRRRLSPLSAWAERVRVRWVGDVVASAALWAACLLVPLALPASAQDVLVRTRLDPAQAVVGQQVRLLVDVMFPGEMGHPPRVATPRVEGAQVLRFESQATTIRDRIGGQAYVGQEFEFDIYPRRAGSLTVPPVTVTLLDSHGDETGTRTGTQQVLQASVPPGLDASQPIVAADHVTMSQTWQPPSGAFRPGDTLIRIVTRRVEGVPGMALADIAFPAPDGVRVYRDPPTIADHIAHGAVTGERTDRVTYLLEQPGSFALPAVTQQWWNLRTHQAATLIGEGQTLTVAGTPAPARTRHFPLAPVVGGIAGLVLLGGLGAWLSRARRAPEAAAYRALRRACRATDKAAAWRAWQAWSALAHTDARLMADIAMLERALFAPGGVWTATEAAELAKDARRARRRNAAHPRRRMSYALPPLNP